MYVYKEGKLSYLANNAEEQVAGLRRIERGREGGRGEGRKEGRQEGREREREREREGREYTERTARPPQRRRGRSSSSRHRRQRPTLDQGRRTRACSPPPPDITAHRCARTRRRTSARSPPGLSPVRVRRHHEAGPRRVAAAVEGHGASLPHAPTAGGRPGHEAQRSRSRRRRRTALSVRWSCSTSARRRGGSTPRGQHASAPLQRRGAKAVGQVHARLPCSLGLYFISRTRARAHTHTHIQKPVLLRRLGLSATSAPSLLAQANALSMCSPVRTGAQAHTLSAAPAGHSGGDWPR